MQDEVKPLKPLTPCRFCNVSNVKLVKTDPGTQYMCVCQNCGAHSKPCKSLLWASTLWNQESTSKIDTTKYTDGDPLPCRFCSEEKIEAVHQTNGTWNCVCTYCGVTGPTGQTQEEAIKKWNH